ncbi:MAG: NAD(P)H-binding protein [Kibdelosporangium sp.]
MRILVTGATGTVGRHVITHLAAADIEVRALTRNPETAALPAQVEVVRGDLDNPDPQVFEAVDRMYLLAMGDTRLAVRQAKQAGVRRIVTLSSAAQDDFHRGMEKIVQDSGLEWTHVRPGMFMANLRDWADGVRKGVVREPYAQARQAPVHEADIAAVAAEALLTDDHVRQIHTLSGPESLTKPEQVRAIARALGRPVEFEEVTPDQWRAQVKDTMPDFVTEFLLAIWATADEPVLPGVGNVLGRPAKTLAEWTADHIADFR